MHQEVQCLSQQLRQFSLTQRQCGHKQALANSHANLPEYPYGPSRWYKQSNFGLYGGLKISSGNNVSEKTETKTRRKWRPNVQMKRLYSHALDRYVRVKVATRVLRTIDKSGGLDEYLVGEKPARIKELGMKGWALRCKVMETTWWKQRQIQEREQYGLSPIRTYVPEEKVDEVEYYDYMVGMYGEKIQDSAIITDEMRALKEVNDEIARGNAAYDKDGNKLDMPDIIAYDEPQELPEESTLTGQFVDVGRIEEEPEFEYVSGKHKRRALIKENKAKAAELRAEHRRQKMGSAGSTSGGALRANDLKQHLAYQQEQDLKAANAVLAASESSATGSRATL